MIDEKDKLLEDPVAEKTSETKVSEDVLNTILSQNMGGGTFVETKPEIEEKEKDIEHKVTSNIEPFGKYSDEIVKDILANPSKYKMNSPKHGEMNLKDALDKGYNPETDEFDRKPKRSKEEFTKGLSDSDKESIDKITDPASARIPKKEADALGVKDSRFIAQDEEATPMMPAPGATPGEPVAESGIEELLIDGGNA